MSEGSITLKMNRRLPKNLLQNRVKLLKRYLLSNKKLIIYSVSSRNPFHLGLVHNFSVPLHKYMSV